MNSKKGFTLIELLAVIVILAVVMLIGVTAVLPLINKAQKNSLASEGLALVDTGKVAYQAEQLAGSELNLSPNASYCFSLDWLRKHNYYDKASEKYSGSVLIMANKSGKFDYYFWITNGNYHISGGTPDTYTVEDGPGDENIFSCGGLDLSDNNVCSYSEALASINTNQCNYLKDFANLFVELVYNNDQDFLDYYGAPVTLDMGCSGNSFSYLSNYDITGEISLPYVLDDMAYVTPYKIVDGYHTTNSPDYDFLKVSNNFSINPRLTPVAMYTPSSMIESLMQRGLAIVILNPTTSSKTITFNYKTNYVSGLNNNYIGVINMNEAFSAYYGSSGTTQVGQYAPFNASEEGTVKLTINSGVNAIVITDSASMQQLASYYGATLEGYNSYPGLANDPSHNYSVKPLRGETTDGAEPYMNYKLDTCGSGTTPTWSRVLVVVGADDVGHI